MKLSIRSLLIILVVLVIAFFAVQMTKRSGRSKSLRSELVAIDTALVSKVEISGPNGEVLLTKEEGRWMVALENGVKETRKNSVETMLNSLNTIKPGRLAARKKDKWKDYAVDSTGTRVKVFNGSDIISDIVLGRFGVEGQRSFHTFVRLFEDENVYVANEFMKMSINENADDYRNNTVLRLVKDSLTQVAFDTPNGSYSLLKNDGWFIGDKEADSVSVAEFLKGLTSVTSKEFYEGTDMPTFTHQVTFYFSDDDEITVEGSMAGDQAVVRSSTNSSELFNDQQLWNKLFKDPDVFAPTLE